jgi:hypothetical protein
VPQLLDVIALQDVQQEQLGGTLGRGRVLVDSVVPRKGDWPTTT